MMAQIINLIEPILEVGGGDRPTFRPNMDVRPLPTVDIVANLEELFPIPDESYGSVYGEYVIEHLSWRTVQQFIRECHRVLVPGGKCVHVTADTREQCMLALDTKEWNEDISCMLFGGQDYSDNTHKNALSPAYAARMFRECGFYSVIIHPHPVADTDMIIEANKSSAVIRIG